MTQEEIFNRTSAILMDCLGLEAQEIHHEAGFIDDLGCDSIGLAEIIMMLEKEFGVQINDAEIEDLRTVGETVECISEKLIKHQIEMNS
jgi:acyl carrier protein